MKTQIVQTIFYRFPILITCCNFTDVKISPQIDLLNEIHFTKSAIYGS